MATDDAPSPALRHVTHELRTRLAAASAAVEGLGDASVAWTDDDRRELLAVAQTSLETIRLLLAELSEAGSGLHLSPAPDSGTPVRRLVAAAVADLGEGVRSPRLLAPSSLPPVRGDPLVVRLVLVGVLRSVLRDPATVRLDIRAATRGDRVVLRIGGGAPAAAGWQDSPSHSGHGDREPPPDVSLASDVAQLLGGTVRTADDRRPGDRAVVVELPTVPTATGSAGQR